MGIVKSKGTGLKCVLFKRGRGGHRNTLPQGIKHGSEGTAMGFYSSRYSLKKVKVFRKWGEGAGIVHCFSNIRQLPGFQHWRNKQDSLLLGLVRLHCVAG